MPVTLFDSLTRSSKPLRQPDPADPKDLFTFYNCGPTVYAPAHIGNFRTFVVNDLLRRVLELEFGPDKVKHVRNITDVDDKTIRRSARRAARSPRSPRSGPTSSTPTATPSTACGPTSSPPPPATSPSRSA